MTVKKKIMRGNTHGIGGFTIIEIVIAAMLVGILTLTAFPLLLTGWKTVIRQQTELDQAMLAEQIFDHMVQEIQSNTGFEIRESNSEMIWKNFEERMEELHLTVHIETTPVQDQWISLEVQLFDDETLVCTREGIIFRLNAGNYGTLQKEDKTES